MKNSKRIFSVFVGLCLLGCTESKDSQTWEITNDSTSDIYVEFVHNGYGANIFDTITAGQSRNIFYLNDSFEENFDSPTQFIYMHISNSQDTLVKDENLDANWLVTSELIEIARPERRYHYSFVVCDSNF